MLKDGNVLMPPASGTISASNYSSCWYGIKEWLRCTTYEPGAQLSARLNPSIPPGYARTWLPIADVTTALGIADIGPRWGEENVECRVARG
jgi:hypothetical protein